MSKKTEVIFFFVIALTVCLAACAILAWTARDYPLSAPIDTRQLWKDYQDNTVLDTLEIGSHAFLLTQDPDGNQFVLRLEKHALLPRFAMPELWYAEAVADSRATVNNYTLHVEDNKLSSDSASLGSGLHWLVLALAVLAATGGIWYFFTTNYRGYLNRKQPVVEVMATVLSHREGGEIVSTGGMLISGSDTISFITFASDNGQLIEVYVGKQDYHTIHDGEYGKLTYQGQRLWRFEKAEKG